MQKQLLVSAIKNGTVIDHIVAGNAFPIIRILNLNDHKKIVAVGLNLPSRHMKIKDIIKVEDRELTPTEANRVAILSPMASINIIKDYNIIKKFKVELPTEVRNLFPCPNPKCICRHENIPSHFYIQPDIDLARLRCHYCEKIFTKNDLKEHY